MDMYVSDGQYQTVVLPEKYRHFLIWRYEGEVKQSFPDKTEGRQTLFDKILLDEQTPEELLSKEELRPLIADALSQLKPIERTVIMYRYGLTGEDPLTYADVAVIVNRSRERVRQLESHALYKLCAILAPKFNKEGAKPLVPYYKSYKKSGLKMRAAV